MPLPTTSLLGLVATSHAIGNGVAGACEPFCADTPCTSLNGDIFTECGGCGESSLCHPGAAGFPMDKWQAAIAEREASQVQGRAARETRRKVFHR